MTTRAHILDASVMLARCQGEPEVIIDQNHHVVIVQHGCVVLRLPINRVARQLAYQLCEVADESDRRNGDR